MSKTVIDLDDHLLAEAAEILGTPTKKATVNAALLAVTERRKREEAFEAFTTMDFLSELADPAMEDKAWKTAR